MSAVRPKFYSPDGWAELIATITTETGFPPTPEELADVTGRSVKSLQSSLTPAKRLGLIGYDENGCLVARSETT